MSKKNEYKKIDLTKTIQLELNPFNLTLIGALLQFLWIFILSWFNIFSDIDNKQLAYSLFVVSLLPASSIYAYGKWLELNLKVDKARKLLNYLILVGAVTFASYWIAFIFSIFVLQLK